MEMIPNWLVSNWDKFSIWVTNQPTFVEVAFGVGLFYAVLLIVRMFYKLLGFLFSGLFTGPRKFKKRKKGTTLGGFASLEGTVQYNPNEAVAPARESIAQKKVRDESL